MLRINRLAAVTITVATIVTACNSDDTATTTTSPSVTTASTPAASTSPTASSTTPPTSDAPTTQPPATSPPTTQPPPTTAITQPTTTEPGNSATPTSSPPPTAPPEGVAIDDWETIIETLDARRIMMLSDLDASDERVLQACTFDGECADQLRQIVASYTADGLRPFYTNWTDVLEAEATVMDGDSLETSSVVRIQTINEARPQVIGYVLNADGSVAYELDLDSEEPTRRRVDYWLARAPGDPVEWRIIRIDGKGPA